MKVVINNLALDFRHSEAELEELIHQRINVPKSKKITYQLIKKSIDARKKPQLLYIYSVLVELDEACGKQALIHPKFGKDIEIYEDKQYVLPEYRDLHSPTNKKMEVPIVIGSGPAGLFSAYLLAKAGFSPLLFERGGCCEERHEKIRDFNEKGILDLQSNIQFGEGGAGTYSDGKLNTGVKDKFLRKEFILRTFVEHGADPSILYMNKPHVGTDYLMRIVVSMREEIRRLGGQVYFNTQVTDLILEGEKVCGVKTQKGNFLSDHIVLAVGHSARDTFRMLHEHKVQMEAKPFAIGVRIEHPQKWINRSQYGEQNESHLSLKAADYKLTYQSKEGRGVYSFCMCPGGIVVNASSHEQSVVCNGMSYFARDQVNANSAIIVSVGPSDFEDGADPLSGIAFQEKWERKAWELTLGKALPVQRYGAFYLDVTGREKQWIQKSFDDRDSIESSCVGRTQDAPIHQCLPTYVSAALVEGIERFGQIIKGFDHPKAVLSAIETRTSSPVRILRDEAFESNIRGLYPCGEGAGYAGGIMSAAIDGLKVAEAIIHELRP